VGLTKRSAGIFGLSDFADAWQQAQGAAIAESPSEPKAAAVASDPSELCATPPCPAAPKIDGRLGKPGHFVLGGSKKQPLTATPELLINLPGKSLDQAPSPHRGRL